MGRIIEIEKIGQFRVTGILKKTNDKSHIQFDALASANTIRLLVTSLVHQLLSFLFSLV